MCISPSSVSTSIQWLSVISPFEVSSDPLMDRVLGRVSAGRLKVGKEPTFQIQGLFVVVEMEVVAGQNGAPGKDGGSPRARSRCHADFRGNDADVANGYSLSFRRLLICIR